MVSPRGSHAAERPHPRLSQAHFRPRAVSPALFLPYCFSFLLHCTLCILESHRSFFQNWQKLKIE